MRATLTLLLLALVAAGVFMFLGAQEDDPAPYEPPPDIEGEPPRDTEEPPESPAAAVVADDPRGVPRVLPPDAAIEDVRDALAVTGDEARADALRAAAGAIGRIAATPRIRIALQRQVLTVEDPGVRGVVYVALGASSDGPGRAWLAERLARESAPRARLGALLGLAQDVDAPEDIAHTLGGLPYRAGPLPDRVDVRDALADVLEAFGATDARAVARDALPMLQTTLALRGTWYAALRQPILDLARAVGE